MNKPPCIPGFIISYVTEEKCGCKEIEKIVFNAVTPELDFSKMVEKVKVPSLII